MPESCAEFATVGIGAPPRAQSGLIVDKGNAWSLGPCVVLKALTASAPGDENAPMAIVRSSDLRVMAIVDVTGSFRTVGTLVSSGDFNGTLNDDGTVTIHAYGSTGIATMGEFVGDTAGPTILTKASSAAGSYNYLGLDVTMHYTFAIEADGSLRWGCGLTKESMDAGLARMAARHLAVIDLERPELPNALDVYGALAEGKLLRLQHDGSHAFVQAHGGHLFLNSFGLDWLIDCEDGAFRPADATHDIGNTSSRPRNVLRSGYSESTAIAEPDAPDVKHARVYADCNSAGKMRLMVKFPTGAAQLLAVEP